MDPQVHEYVPHIPDGCILDAASLKKKLDMHAWQIAKVCAQENV